MWSHNKGVVDVRTSGLRAINFCLYNSERMVKIGAELPKLSPNKSGYPFLDHPVHAAVDVRPRCADSAYQ